MHIRIVTFGLDGLTVEEYEQQAMAVAESFLEWPGLLAKWWLADADTNTYGGVYLFTDQQAADASRRTPLFSALASHPAFTELQVREFGVLAAPSAVTTPAHDRVAEHLASGGAAWAE